jgi:hypothetical protein
VLNSLGLVMHAAKTLLQTLMSKVECSVFVCSVRLGPNDCTIAHAREFNFVGTIMLARIYFV